MLKVRSILFGFLVFISLCSYAQRDSTLNHKTFIGVGTEPIMLLENTANPRGFTRVVVYAQIGYKHAFKHFNFRANFEGIYRSRGWFSPMFRSMRLYPSFGLERRLNPRSKVQVLYGMDMLVDIWMGITFPGITLEHIGIGPVLGIEYKLAKNIYVAHEISAVYGPWLWNLGFGNRLWWDLNAHKVIDITVYYGF